MSRAGRLLHVCERVLSWRYPAVLIGIGMVPALPTLWSGLFLDDYTIRSATRGDRPGVLWHTSPWEPFTFLDGDPQHNRVLMDYGVLPWWTDPGCRAAFWRPLTALTHIVDYRVWPNLPAVMHLQSLLWFALLIWAAATLYRRLLCRAHAPWVALLAALLFTLDDAHGTPVGWLANRSTLIAGVFGMLSLIALDRWRRDGWRPGAVLAPAALLAGLLAKEVAVCTGFYLVAYAVFLDRGRWRRRLAALVPCVLVGVIWYVVYRCQGFGIYRAGLYTDPAHDPWGFLRHVVDHGPVLLLGQWGVPASDLSTAATASFARIHWAGAVVYLAALVLLFRPLLLRDRLARFWATGMMLSLLPACMAFPSDRMLMFVGLGAMGLLAQFLAGLREGADWLPSRPTGRWPTKAFAAWFVLVHLVLAPMAFPILAAGMSLLNGNADKLMATLPKDPQFESQTAVFVDLPSWALNVSFVQARHYNGQPVAARALVLGPTCAAVSLTRTGETTLSVRPEGGYLAAQGGAPKRTPSWPDVSVGNALRSLDLIVRSHLFPLRLGERVEMAAATVEVTELIADGRPAEVEFDFRLPLEDPSLRWLRIRRREGFVAFTPPQIGETVRVESLLR